MRICCLMPLLIFTLMASALVLAQGETEDEEAAEDGFGQKQYINIKPSFVANYGGPGRLRYLKADVTLRVGDRSVSAVRRHMPYIRHALVMLLSKSTEEEVSSMEGRELVRQNALAAIQNVLIEEEGEQYIADLLFNSFIVQR